MIKAILFDLDGTLLPVDQDEFTKAYFAALAKSLAPHGYDPKQLINGVWQGTVAMLKNDGSVTNAEAFWRTFAGFFGDSALADKVRFDEFYEHGFEETKAVCGYSAVTKRIIAAAKSHGVPLVLASNPIFPESAQIKRAEWSGAKATDFALVTSYENSHYCKPRTAYYAELANALGVKPDECLMIGNDTSDDMTAAELGMRVFLITDCLINKDGRDISVYPHGNAEDLAEFLTKLDGVNN